MKKYIKPETGVFEHISMNHLLGASDPKGDSYGRWGNGDPNEPFGNENWVTEGYDDDLVIGGTDDGETDSRAKSSGIWDEW